MLITKKNNLPSGSLHNEEFFIFCLEKSLYCSSSPKHKKNEEETQEIMPQEITSTTAEEEQVSTRTQPFQDGEIDSELEVDTGTIPQPKFDVFQKVLAKDLPLSSLLWEAKILERLYTKHPLSDDNDCATTILGQHQTGCCWRYYVHYQGWNNKWNAWCYEDEVVSSTRTQPFQDDEIDSELEVDTGTIPQPKFDVFQKVLARGFPLSSLLWEAKILERLYTKHPLSDDNDCATTILGQHQTGCCWRYYVHYQGWNNKWNAWCYEDEVFDDSIESRELAEQLRLESTDEKKVGCSKKTPGKKSSLNGKNDAIVSHEQPAQMKRKIDDAAVKNKTASSKRRTSSHVNVPSRKRRSATESSSKHFADSNLSVKPVAVHSQEKEAEGRTRSARRRNVIKREEALLAQPETYPNPQSDSSSPKKENSSSSLENVEEPDRRLFAELENNQASKSLFNDQSLIILVDSGKKAHRAIKHDCLVKNEGVRIVKRNPNGQIYFVEDLHKHVHCSASSKQSADLQKVCKNVEVIETDANVFQEDFAVWNADDEEHPFLEDTATLIQKVFVGFQTAMQVPKKHNARGTIATNVGLTTTDCHQYSENRTTILETVKPYLTKLVCIAHQPPLEMLMPTFHAPNLCILSHSLGP